MLRTSFTKQQILENTQDFGLTLEQEPELTILPSQRGSVVKIQTTVGTALIKYADLNNATTEHNIIPPRSIGLRNEATRLQQLNSKQTPVLLNYNDGPKAVWEVIEFMEGETLKMAAINNRSMRQQLVRQLIQSASNLHSQGLLHGDIQPNNVLVDTQGIKFIDLELTHELDSPALAAGHYDYISPNVATQLIHHETPTMDQAEETFALAMTSLSILTSHSPAGYDHMSLTSDDKLHFISNGPSYSTLGALEVDLPLATEIARVLEYPQDKRPTTPIELLELIGGFTFQELEASNE